jgi:hypothetical protein
LRVAGYGVYGQHLAHRNALAVLGRKDRHLRHCARLGCQDAVAHDSSQHQRTAKDQQQCQWE